ncbi:hypothetical protein C0995_004866 [Termitomyces sp. Mi166|nr:hypothetical protein C0995_004866 [Termitomyces sp. Mi166\
MRKRADALEEYVNLLESMLEKCRREHGGGKDNGESYLQFRPRDAEGIILPDEVDVEDNDDPNDEDRVFSQELCLPTRNLKLEEGNLLLHGNTAVFRFAPERPMSPPTSRFPLNSKSPRYALLVEGLDDKNYNPDFDWSRYLPASVPLDRKEHDRLIDLVFKFFMSWCLRIVPDLFLRDMYQTLSTPRSQTPPKTVHYSPMLHNALLAVATAFSDDPRIRDLKARQAFATLAKSYVEAECQQPNISVAHALSSLGSYHSGLGEQTLGYLYFGMSARMSQALGLSIDCSAWVKSGLITENDMFDRNWAFWTIFTQDVCWSLYVGRDFSIPFYTTSLKRIPIPIVDARFDSVPWYHPPSGIAPQPNCLSKTFAASCELLMIARRIMDVVNGLNNASVRHEVNHELISNIDLQLNTWKSNLSSDLDITLKSRPTATPHRLMMHCTYWWFFILLHRPFYHRKQRPADRQIDHVKLCKRAAENIVELLSTWRSLYTLRYAPITLVQTAFSAGTIYLLGAVQAATGLRVAQESLKHALAQAQLCVEYLFEIGKSWQCATNIGEILRRLLQEQLKPLLDKRAIRAYVMSGPVPQNQNQTNQQKGNGGSPASPNPSSGSLSRRRSPSQRRSTPGRDEGLRGRPSVTTFRTGLPKSASSSHHRPSIESHSQPHSPSFLVSRSSSIPNMVFHQSSSSWPMDYSPTSPATDDSMSPFFQSFGSSGSENRTDVSMDVDFGAAMHGGVFDAKLGFSEITDANGGIERGDGLTAHAIDPSSFLAMLGGEPLSDAPFLPTFDSYSPPAGEGSYSPRMQPPSTSMSTSFEGPI